MILTTKLRSVLIPDDHAQLVTEYVAAGNNEVHSFTMGCYVDGVVSDAQDVANRFSDIFKNRFQTGVANEVTVLTTTAYYRQGADLFVGVSDRASWNGTLGVNAQPPAISWLVRKQTGLAGRKYRGRGFWPQPRDDDVNSGGGIVAASQTAINAKLALILSDMNDNGVFGWAPRPRLLHSDLTPPTEITALIVDPIVGVQRRRSR